VSERAAVLSLSRLRASLAILPAADALKVEEIGPTSADDFQAKLEHTRFLEALGG
jgi:hypothetical protein